MAFEKHIVLPASHPQQYFADSAAVESDHRFTGILKSLKMTTQKET
jgi:hypothetical protein